MTTIAIVVLLILAGMVMIFFEFLTPTFGPLAVMGLACLGGAAWQCFTISTFAGVISIAAMLVGLPVYILAMVRIMPRLPLTRSLFLHKFPVSTASGSPVTPELLDLVGKTGVAETLLRPGGAIRVEGRRVDAQAESGIIPAGQAVKVVAVGMGNVIVRRVETPSRIPAGESLEGRSHL